MFKSLFFMLFMAIIASGCLKQGKYSCPYSANDVKAPQSEQDSVKAYLDSNNIDATLHPAGFYYKIITPGSGAEMMTLCSQLQINYLGKLVTDSVFDKGEKVNFVLGALIEGWRKGIPLIKRDGEIRLFIPPSLGYGDQEMKNTSGQVVIPSKSILIFDVKLLDYTAGN